jgi:hypothetical protein
VVYSQSSYGAVIMDSNNLEVFYVVFIFAALLSACYSAFNLFLMVRVGENLLKTLRMK